MVSFTQRVRTRYAWRAALATAGTAGLLAVSILLAPSAGAATRLTAANFRLKASAYSPVIASLDAVLPHATVANVVDDANRTANRCTPAATPLLAAFCWDSGDNGVTYWHPQGVTTTADAYAVGTYEDRTAILVSWHYDIPDVTDNPDKGIRISFVDWSNPAAPVYRHVLLVEPYTNGGNPDFRQVAVHAGGMFWYGYYLYVVDTDLGFRVFDMRHIWQVSTGNESLLGRQSNGAYHAYNYKYVIPQAFTYTRSSAGGYTNLTYSFASLDRTSTPDSVVVGEYGNPGTGTRLARFGIDSTNRMLRADSDGYARATEAYDVSVTSMQGATAIGGKFYLSTSDGSGARGDLATFTPGGSVVTHNDTLPIGPEDLSYWAGRDQLWSVTEYATQRSVFAIRASSY